MGTVGSDISDYILEHYSRPLQILEAGGGSEKFFAFPSGSRFTVVDISPEQKEANSYAEEFVVADLHDYDFGAARFDIVVFHNVLEHLKDPASVVSRAVGGIRPGGGLIVGGPIVGSVQGMVTKFTPHWFHVLVYRHLFNHPTAGQPGSPPFPTYLRWDANPRQLRQQIEAAGFRIVVDQEFESSQIDRIYNRSKAIYGLYRLTAAAMWALSLGRIRRNATDFRILAIKPA